MKQNRAGLLIAIFLVTALAFGALHQSPWFLVIPPIVLVAERLLVLSEQTARMRGMGAGVEASAFYWQMTLPVLGFAVWNGVLCAAFFAAAWIVSSLVA